MIGIVGGVIGVGLGFLGAALVAHFSPPLTRLGRPEHRQRDSRRRPDVRRRSGGARPGGGGGGGGGVGGGFRRLGSAAAHTVAVHLTAPVTAERHRGRRAAGDRRRPDRRRLRRLARGPAAAGGGAGEGRVTGRPGRRRRGPVARPSTWPGDLRTRRLQERGRHVQADRVKKDYQKGRGTVAALQGVDLEHRRRRVAGHPGPDRARQVRRCCRCSAAWTGRPRADPVRRLDGAGPGAAAGESGDQGAGRVDRIHLPDLQPDADAERAGERGDRAGAAARSAARERRQRAAERARRRGPGRPAPGTCRPSCPAVSSSASRSPGRWSSSPRCCWPTSRPATWTRAPGTRSSACWRSCGAEQQPDAGARHARQHGRPAGAAPRRDEEREAVHQQDTRPPPRGQSRHEPTARRHRSR